MPLVLCNQSIPADIQRVRREIERKRLDQLKRIREVVKKLADEEKDTWFPPPKKSEPTNE